MEPLFVDGVSVSQFIQIILDNHAPPTMLVVCNSRSAFIEQLLASFNKSPDVEESSLLSNTLHMLSQTRTLPVAFCPSLDAVKAYLSTRNAVFRGKRSTDVETGSQKTPMLAILNLVGAHRETSSWSAQGIGRTIAVAVETARGAGQQLVLAECSQHLNHDGSTHQLTADPETRSGLEHGHDDEPTTADLGERQHNTGETSVWDEQVAILNVTTRSFGAGERGWIGRTVKLRQIAERWCRFHTVNLDSNAMDDTLI